MVHETAFVLYIEHETVPISKEDRILMEAGLNSDDLQVLSIGHS